MEPGRRYMLFDILAIIVVIYAVFSPVWVLKAVKFGISVGNDPKEAVDEPIFHVPSEKKKVKAPILSKEEQQIVDILENVDIYDGTSRGQKEIEV